MRGSVSFQSHGQRSRNTAGPTVAIATSDAGTATRALAVASFAIARPWISSACGRNTPGSIQALCFVSRVSPYTTPARSAAASPPFFSARQYA